MQISKINQANQNNNNDQNQQNYNASSAYNAAYIMQQYQNLMANYAKSKLNDSFISHSF